MWVGLNFDVKYQINIILAQEKTSVDLYLPKKKSVVVKTRLTKKHLEMPRCLLDLVLAFGTVWFWLSRFGSSYGKCVSAPRDSLFSAFYALSPTKITSWIKERISVRDTEEAKSFHLENRERERCKTSQKLPLLSPSSDALGFVPFLSKASHFHEKI